MQDNTQNPVQPVAVDPTVVQTTPAQAPVQVSAPQVVEGTDQQTVPAQPATVPGPEPVEMAPAAPVAEVPVATPVVENTTPAVVNVNQQDTPVTQ